MINYESIKDLEIKTSTLFNLTILFYLIDVYFLIPAVIAQKFNPTGEHVIPIGVPTKKVKTEMEIIQ